MNIILRINTNMLFTYVT